MVQIDRRRGASHDDSRPAFLSSWDGGGGPSASSYGLLPSSASSLANFFKKIPLSVLAMTFAAFAIGVHLGYERGIGASLLEFELESLGHPLSSSSSLPAPVHRSLSTSELLGEFSKARRNVRRKLNAEYGHYSGVIFDKIMLNRRIITSTDESRGRLRRRILTKIVRARMAVEESEREREAAEAKFGREAVEGRTAIPDRERVKFAWVTAGDSSAAGWGNEPYRDYTSVLHDTVHEAFASLGVEFEARNLAMGDDADGRTSSAPAPAYPGVELSLCMESVYGPDDVDVLSHDFSGSGSFSPPASRRAALWSSRAAVHPSRPALLTLTSSSSPRWSAFQSMDGKGTASILMDDQLLDGMLTPRLADAGDASRDHDSLTPPLKNFVCGGRREGTGPCDDVGRRFACEVEQGAGQVCLAEKFGVAMQDCADPRAQAIWNRGWKEHLLRGRLLGSYLLEVTHEALIELDELRHPPKKTKKVAGKAHSYYDEDQAAASYESILRQLEAREEVDKFLFESSPPAYGAWDADADALAEIAPEMLFRRRGICMTGLGLGAVASSPGLRRGRDQEEERERSLLGEEEGGDPGAAATSDADSAANVVGGEGEEEELRLEFDPAQSMPCRDDASSSRRGFFQVKEGEGWRYIDLPDGLASSDGGGETPLRGSEGGGGRMIVVCFQSYSTQEENLQSLGGGLDSMKLAHGNIVAEVNGAKAIGSREVDGCHWLERGEGGGLMWDPAPDVPPSSSAGAEAEADDGLGRFRVRFRVDEPGAYIRISSIGVF
uniref:Uncharacterized protein n=1 Tax=Odontella aurita TaxID=265563 RepID=A0A7S4N5K9_9STRA|mmetsp:Transcript_4885/g.13907  ORF Transcript_4885/g.13907 Transcript_4885/m.13907 type:complete len:778 (+) Transcript_4885:161-2494(+)